MGNQNISIPIHSVHILGCKNMHFSYKLWSNKGSGLYKSMANNGYMRHW